MEVDSTKPHATVSVEDNEPVAKKARDDAKCPICLTLYKDPSIIRTCEHVFCFDCIRKWISQKPNCPLCKQRVDLIKHRFKQDHRLEPTWKDEGKTVTAREIIEHEEFKRLSEHSWPLDSELQLIDGASHKLNSMLSTCSFDLLNQIAQLKVQLHKLRFDAERKSRINIIRHPLFRFVIYFMDADRHSLITTHTDIALNSQYVRENREKLRSELLPFVIREIHAITGLEAISTDKIMDLLLNSFENSEQKKDSLFGHLKSIGIDHPRTFYRFVCEFASSDQSLKLYDTNSRFKLKTSLSSTFTEDSSEEIQVISPYEETDEIQFVGTSRIVDPRIITLT